MYHSKRTSRLRTCLFQSRFSRIGFSRSFIHIAYMTTRADRKGSCILIRTRYIQPPVRERKNGKWTFGVPTSTDLHLKPNNAFGTIHGHIQCWQRKFGSWQIPVCSSEHELTPEIAVRSDLCHSKRTSRLRTSLFQSRINRIGSSRSFIRIAYMTTRADRKGSCILIRT